jgi:integrase
MRRSVNTKTLTKRTVPISARLLEELLRLQRNQPIGPNERVFGHISRIYGIWKTACKEAQIEDLHFHDLRAAFTTRLIEAGMAIEQVAKITGHSQLSTLYEHYLRNTSETLERAADLLNQMNDSNREGQGSETEFIN